MDSSKSTDFLVLHSLLLYFTNFVVFHKFSCYWFPSIIIFICILRILVFRGYLAVPWICQYWTGLMEHAHFRQYITDFLIFTGVPVPPPPRELYPKIPSTQWYSKFSRDFLFLWSPSAMDESQHFWCSEVTWSFPLYWYLKHERKKIRCSNCRH